MTLNYELTYVDTMEYEGLLVVNDIDINCNYYFLSDCNWNHHKKMTIKANTAYVKFDHDDESFQFIIKKDNNEYITLDNVPKIINTYGTYNNIFDFDAFHQISKYKHLYEEYKQLYELSYYIK